MGWATDIVKDLVDGRTVICNPEGFSMEPLICSKDKVTIKPADAMTVEKGDIVMCRVNGRYYLHKVLATRPGEVEIGNNKGHINGWTDKVFGKVIQVDHKRKK